MVDPSTITTTTTTEPARKKLTGHEVPLFEKLSATLDELDPSSVFVFAGRLHLHDDEREAIRLFIEEKEGAKLRSFPLDESAAKALYEAGSEFEGGKGRILKPEQFALTGKVPIPQWVLARLSNNYSEPLELCLDGLICLAEGDSIPLPKRDAEADEAFRFGQFEKHTGTLLLALPTSFTGGKLNFVRPQTCDSEATPFTGSIDWSIVTNGQVLPPTKACHWAPTVIDDNFDESEQGKWQIPWMYYEPPVRISIDEIIKGHMLVLRYQLRTTEEDDERGKGGRLPFIDPDIEVGTKVIVDRLKVLLGDKRVLTEGGQLGFGLMGYDFPDEEVKEEEEADGEDPSKDGCINEEAEDLQEEEKEADAEDNFDKEDEVEEEDPEETFPIRKITPEEEKAFLDNLPKQFKLRDRCIVKGLEELGLKWEIGGVWLYTDDDEVENDGEGEVENDSGIGGESGGGEGEGEGEGEGGGEGDMSERKDGEAEEGDEEDGDAQEVDGDGDADGEKDSNAEYERRQLEGILVTQRQMSAFEQGVWGDVVTGVEVNENTDTFKFIYKPVQATFNGQRITVNSLTNLAAEQEEDPTLEKGTWITPPGVSLFCVQGLKTKDHPEADAEGKVKTSKVLLSAGVKKDASIYWVKTPNEYRIETTYRTSDNETETIYIGLALFVNVPPAAER
ncbi:hypothetical protein IAT40_004168 [Kwoniella sp. CBS 6097]